MTTYSQLTYEQRCQISALLQAGLKQTEIASQLGCHQSTISREVRRNKGQRGYRHKQAQRLATERRQSAVVRHKMTPTLINLIESKLRLKWSPEQIAKWLEREEQLAISHEAIYLHVWADKAQGGCLYEHLRHRVKGYRHRGESQSSRGKIKNRVSIHERPAIVETRERTGDWEIDLMIGKGHSGALLTLVERKTRFSVAAAIDDKSAASVTEATIALLAPFKASVLTITADNGKEFSGHEAIANALDCDVYFADPYSSWQRGLNENTNGLLRQYWPKNTDFKTVTQDEVFHVLDELNHRPRKVLDYKTPADIFLAETNFSGYALQS